MVNGIYPTDYLTVVGQTRVLIPDTAVDATTNEYIFSDDQITSLLSLFNGNPMRAAAQAKDILATDNVLLLKVVRTDDLNVNGAAVAAELRLEAKQLREQADAADKAGVFDYFQIVGGDDGCYPEGVPVWGRHLVEIGSCC